MGLLTEHFDESPSALKLFKCGLCRRVVQEGVILCQHIIVCRSHNEDAKKSKSRECQDCSENPHARSVDALSWIDNKLKAFKIRCQNDGCKVSSSKIEEHQAICPYGLTSCPNEGCSERIRLKEVDSHAAKCPFKLLQCTRAGCQVAVRRRDTKKHDEECAFHSCPYAMTDNCPTRSTKTLLQAHVAYCTKLHDELASSRAQNETLQNEFLQFKNQHDKERIGQNDRNAETSAGRDISENGKTRPDPFEKQDQPRLGTKACQTQRRFTIRRNTAGAASNNEFKSSSTLKNHLSAASSVLVPTEHIPKRPPLQPYGLKRPQPFTVSEEVDELESTEDIESFSIDLRPKGTAHGAKRPKRDVP